MIYECHIVLMMEILCKTCASVFFCTKNSAERALYGFIYLFAAPDGANINVLAFAWKSTINISIMLKYNNGTILKC